MDSLNVTFVRQRMRAVLQSYPDMLPEDGITLRLIYHNPSIKQVAAQVYSIINPDVKVSTTKLEESSRIPNIENMLNKYISSSYDDQANHVAIGNSTDKKPQTLIVQVQPGLWAVIC